MTAPDDMEMEKIAEDELSKLQRQVSFFVRNKKCAPS